MTNAPLTQLGEKTTYHFDYDPKILERFENRHRDTDLMVTLNCPEFTSLCPITNQPDFATLYINYIPDQWCVESKSLKLYLFSFRNHGAFHEDCICTLLGDLDTLMQPRYIEVRGHFLPRGGISIDPFVNKGKGDKFTAFAEARLLAQNSPQLEVRNR